jgi:hypothetical protein
MAEQLGALQQLPNVMHQQQHQIPFTGSSKASPKKIQNK